MADDIKSEYKCVLCNTILESKEELQTHFRKHANKEIDCKGIPSSKKTHKKPVEKEDKDDKEDKEEKDSSSIAENSILFTNVACDVCCEVFSSSAMAIQHKFRKHPEVTDKFFCSYCGMQFTIKSLYDRHIKSHSSDTRKKSSIRCDLCNVEFFFLEAEEYHMKSTHKRVMRIFQPIVTAPPSKKIKFNNAGELQSVYFCHLCGSEYIIKFNLQKHLEKDHTEEERSTVPADLVRCTTCDALFYNQKAYKIHNISHRPGDLYVTSEQQRLNTVSRVDQDFDIRRVLPLAHKYLSSYKHRPKAKTKLPQAEKKGTEADEELSPPSTPDPSDSSDSDSDIPLKLWAEKHKLKMINKGSKPGTESKASKG